MAKTCWVHFYYLFKIDGKTERKRFLYENERIIFFPLVKFTKICTLNGCFVLFLFCSSN